MRYRLSAVAALSLAALIVPSMASAYTSRQATHAESLAIIKDAKRTEPCGYSGHGHLGAFRVVQYAARGVVFKWAAARWTLPGANACVLVFLRAGGHSFSSNHTPRHAKVSWLPFTWGSAPFENHSYLDHEWGQLRLGTGPPQWTALARAL